MQGLCGRIGSFLFLAGTIGTELVGQRHFFQNSNPKRKRGNESGTIPRLRFGLQKRSVSAKTGAVQPGRIFVPDPINSASDAVTMSGILHPLGGVFGPDTPVGWPNRTGIMSGCAWLMIVSWRAMSTKC